MDTPRQAAVRMRKVRRQEIGNINMTEDRKHEQNPWSPTLEREPLFTPFENPRTRNSGLHDPVELMDEDSGTAEPRAQISAVTRFPRSEAPMLTDEPK
jgi:hypothetical protein